MPTARSPWSFLDMRMPPGPDGAWAAARIREMDPYVDIVIVTAYSDVDPRTMTTQSPLFYIQKPLLPGNHDREAGYGSRAHCREDDE